MTKKTKKQKEDEAIEALLKKIPKGETMIIEETNGKTTVFVTRTPYKRFPFSYIM